MSGRLIVMESGTDASGKETQTERLYNRLQTEGYRVRRVEYPNYDSDSSALIKMYLNGEFGDDPSEVNSYAASAFYAVDRYASFKQDWQEFYESGGIIIADRYTTSNMVHQASKIDDVQKRDGYLDWLWEFEFDKIGLPVPDAVIFLDLSPEESTKLMSKREGSRLQKDIHESNFQYQLKTYQNACQIADKYDWDIVDCLEEGKLKTIAEIHQEIYRLVKPKLEE